MTRRIPILILAAVAACSSGDGARVTIELASLHTHAAQTRVPIDGVELVVTGHGVDLAPVAVDTSTFAFEVEVAAGRARTFAIEAYAEGDPERLTAYWGASQVDLSPRTETELTIPLVRAGRVWGSVSLSGDRPPPASVAMRFSAAQPRPEVPAVLTVVATSGSFSAPLPTGEYLVEASVAHDGATWVLPAGTRVHIVHGQAHGPVDLTLVSPAGLSGSVVSVMDASGALLADMTVLVHADDGVLRQQYVTGPDGTVEVDLASGNMVSVASALASQYGEYYVATAAGVEPGDHLTFRLRGQESFNPIGTLQVTLATLSTGGGNHAVDIGCGAMSLAVGEISTVWVYDSCVGSDGMVDALAIADDGQGHPVGFATALDLPVNGGSATIDTWDESPPSIDVQATNSPGLDDVYFNLTTVRDRVEYQLGQFEIQPPKGVLQVSFRVPSGFFDYQEVIIGTGGPYDWRAVTQRFVDITGPTPYNVDLSTTFLPLVESVMLDEVIDPARPLLTWSTQATPADIDLKVVRASWDASPDALIWEVMLPADSPASWRFPDMPASLAAYRPDTYNSGLSGTASIEIVEISSVTGYRQLVTEIGPQILDPHAPGVLPLQDLTIRKSMGTRISP